MHVPEHPSPGVAFPSSHCSELEDSFFEFPHFRLHTESTLATLVHSHPDSTVHVLLHPSEFELLSSSQTSEFDASSFALPQIF
jgi:hypothetical protein